MGRDLGYRGLPGLRGLIGVFQNEPGCFGLIAFFRPAGK